MKPLLIAVILVDHKFQALGRRFVVETAQDDLLFHLITKVKEKRHRYFSGHDTYISELVWRTKGENVINKFNYKRLAEILRSINIHDEDTIEKLPEDLKVADLGLSNCETLLVQMPAVIAEDGPVGTLITSKYAHCFLQAISEGNFEEIDITLNKINEAARVAPKFVKEYEKILGRKREVAPDVHRLAEVMFSHKPIFEQYCCLMAESSQSMPIVNQPELDHIYNLSTVNTIEWDPLNSKKPFEENDAYWLLFYPFANHCSSLPLIDGGAQITVKRSQESWPFPLVVQIGKDKYCSYRPKNSFLLLKSGLPRLAVEVNSHPQEYSPVEFYRLLIEGASVVRFANTSLDAYKTEKDFIFVAIFIRPSGEVDRYLLYQDHKKDAQKVHSEKRTFNLAIMDERIRFALELYNFSSALHAKSDEGYTQSQVEKLTYSLWEFKIEHDLPAFSRGKGTADNNAGNQRQANRRRTSNSADDQLEDSGYEVMPDVLETKGGTWELINKLPPNIRRVFRRNDPNKTELIAKRVRKGSNERAIHEYLHSRQPQSPHVISLIEAIPSSTRPTTSGWLILPKLRSMHDQQFINRGSIDCRVRFGWGLIKGLAYLHEHNIAHRDIKPDNLVCDHDFVLKIIDFDTAIEVQDENTEIDEYCGTEAWTAPEIGKEDGPTAMYSPIKADRWSCGCVILRHILVGLAGKGDSHLSKFANRLMAKDPEQRPSQLEWHKLLAPPVSKLPIVEVGGESAKPPAAKKPRLERSDQSVP